VACTSATGPLLFLFIFNNIIYYVIIFISVGSADPGYVIHTYDTGPPSMFKKINILDIM
jgi:hypothetical protein